MLNKKKRGTYFCFALFSKYTVLESGNLLPSSGGELKEKHTSIFGDLENVIHFWGIW